jgi:hypothetical protein
VISEDMSGTLSPGLNSKKWIAYSSTKPWNMVYVMDQKETVEPLRHLLFLIRHVICIGTTPG